MANLNEAQREESWLVLRAQAGELEALDALFRRIQDPLFRYVRGMVRDSDLARDILQETLLRIYRKLPWLREPAFFRAWSYRIATHEVFRHTRRKQAFDTRVDHEVVLDELATAERLEPDAELIAGLPALVEEVSPASRAVLVLFYLQELSLDEVAQILGIPIGTVKSRLAYGLAVLRRRVSPGSDARGKGDVP